MFQRIVVAWDGSDEARAGARFAMALGASGEAAVTLIHVVHLSGAGVAHPEALIALDERRRQAEDDARLQLDALIGEAPAGVAADALVLHGSPAATLIDYLSESGADLVVVGTHGVGGLRHRLQGSVSRQVMEHAPCSVLLFRHGAIGDGPPTVLAGLDGSQESLRGLAAAQALAAALGAPLRLVHIADPRLPFAFAPAPREVVELFRRSGEDILHDARAAVTEPIDDVAEELRIEDPREGLLAVCEQHLPAVMVVGSRGLGGFRGLLVGSTARVLVDHAPCPVLVSRAGAATVTEH